jgi:magnesium transporter
MPRNDEANRPTPRPDQAAANAERMGISSRKVGLAPGSVVYTGRQHVAEMQISTMTYTATELEEKDNLTLEELVMPPSEYAGAQWVNIVGLHETDRIIEVGERYDLHSLLLEDVVSVRTRPTFVDYEDHAFISENAGLVQ